MTEKDFENLVSNNIWIFHASPERYEISKCFADQEYKGQITWNVNRYKDKIKKNGVALIWMSGKNAGIYAIGEIISDPDEIFEFPWEEKYWLNLNDADKGKSSCKVIINIHKDMTRVPLLQKELKIKNIEGLQGISNLNPWQKTNIPVTQDEWDLLKKFI